MTRVRLGIAILLPEPARTEVRALRRALGSPSLDTQPPHITLVPPVNVRAEHIDDVMAVARSAAASVDGPLRLRLGPPATFAPVSPVLYLGVHGDAVDRLRTLPSLLLQGPLQRMPTYDYVPHCTLHELADDELVNAAMRSMGDFRWVIEANGFDVLRQDDDRVWRTLADFTFAQPVVRGRGGIEIVLRRSSTLPPDAARLLEAVDAIGVEPVPEGWSVDARNPAGVLLGAVSGVFDTNGVGGRFADIEALAVDPAERRQGIGDRLLEETVLFAGQVGVSGVRVCVGTDGWIHRWYARRGFGAELTLPSWRRGVKFERMVRGTGVQ